MLFVLAAQAQIPYDDVEGFVCAEQCTRSCDGQPRGCSYGGSVDLCFFVNATPWLVPWRVTTAPQAACGGDCCATLLRDQTPVWIVLDSTDPPHVASFYRSAADIGDAFVGGPYGNGGTALLVLATVLSCLVCLTLCVKAQSC